MMKKNERLRFIRNHLGLSLRRLESLTNTNYGVIAAFERVETRNVSDNILIFYHQKGFSLEWILTGEGEMIREGFNPKPE